MQKKNEIEAIASALTVAAGGTSSNEMIALLAAKGFALVPKSDADMLENVRRKTGGVHPTKPGCWHVISGNGWVGITIGLHNGGDHGMFCPAEAREIATSLILFAEQEERRR